MQEEKMLNPDMQEIQAEGGDGNPQEEHYEAKIRKKRSAEFLIQLNQQAKEENPINYRNLGLVTETIRRKEEKKIQGNPETPLYG